MRRIVIVTMLVCLALLIGLRAARMPGRGDAVSLYYGSRVLLEGHNPYRLSNLAETWRRDGSPADFRPDMMERVFITPPAIALLLAPIALLPPAIGIPGMSAYNFLFALLCLFCFYQLTRGRWSLQSQALFAAFVLCQRPAMAVYHNGQSTLVFCALLAGMLWLLALKRDAPAGVLLGLALTKFTLSLPFLCLLAYRRQWRSFIIAILVSVGLNLLLALPWGLHNLLPDYRAAVLYTAGPGSPQDPAGATRFDMIHAERLLFSLMGPVERGEVKIALLLFTTLSVAILIYLLRPSRNPKRAFENPLEIAIAMMTALLFFYHRYYDLACLMFVAYGLAEYAYQHKRPLPIAWKLSMGLLLLLTFATSATGWSALFDPQLARLGLPTTPYYNAPMVALLFITLLWLMAEQQMRAPQRETLELRDSTNVQGGSDATVSA